MAFQGERRANTQTTKWSIRFQLNSATTTQWEKIPKI